MTDLVVIAAIAAALAAFVAVIAVIAVRAETITAGQERAMACQFAEDAANAADRAESALEQLQRTGPPVTVDIEPDLVPFDERLERAIRPHRSGGQ